jgi:hypothetical protein
MHAQCCSPRRRLLPAGLSFLVFASFLVTLPTAEAARQSREVAPPPAEAEATAPADPYIAYLDALGAHSESCKSQTEAVKEMLGAMDGLVSKYQSTAGDDRKQLVQELSNVAAKLSEAENQLAECYELVPLSKDNYMLWSAAEAPPLPEPAPPPPPPPAPANTEDMSEREIREAEKKRAEAFAASLPPPKPLIPAVPPAPPREQAFVELLQSEAGDSSYGTEYASDTENFLAERRQLALRYLQAQEQDRAQINFLIATVSRRVHHSANGVINPDYLASN